MQTEIREAYGLLELSPGAPLAEVRRAWRELVQVWHPDRFPGNERLRSRAEQRVQDLNEAYQRVCAWLEAGGGSAARPGGRGRTEPPPRRDPGEAFRDRERGRRAWLHMGPWGSLDHDHMVLRSPGDDQVVTLSQVKPLPFVQVVYDRDLWVTTVAAGPGRWLTAASRVAGVEKQRFHQSATSQAKLQLIQELYEEGHSLTAYAEDPDGTRVTVMTRGLRTGSERYRTFRSWPRAFVRDARKERDEAVVGVAGVAGWWHVITAQVPGWGGQRISTRHDWEGLQTAVATAWEEDRRLTSVGWRDGTYVLVATSDSGMAEQSYAHLRSPQALSRSLQEQWDRGRHLTAACHDDDGWLCVFSSPPALRAAGAG